MTEHFISVKAERNKLNKVITIGITDCSKYENYHRWIEQEKDIKVIRLSYRQNNLADISKCDGIVLTGGGDLHPRLYSKQEYLELCDDIDESRDAFEWKVLEYTEKNQVPVLGICRGLQVANVFFGGSLLPDIPSFGKFDHSNCGKADRYHTLQVDPNSMLSEIVGSADGEVNSAHHQSADRIGKGLVTSALSPDGIVEGMERQNLQNGAFLLLVQWHPERMKDQQSLFSRNIREKFIDATRGPKR